MSQVIGSSFISISHSGVRLFQDEVSAVVGSVEVDLVSAPIPPGEYTLRITTGVGSVDVYLPSYVTFTSHGGSGLGSLEVIDGFDFFERVGRKITGWVSTNAIPDHAAKPVDPNAAVHIRFEVTLGVGTLTVHRLPVAE